MKKKKHLRQNLVIVSLLVMMLPQTLVYGAGNYKDTDFTFKFTEYCPFLGHRTAARAKQDYTSSYMKCKSLSNNYSYNATVYAVNPNGTTWTNTYYAVGSPSYTFRQGTTKYMINYVKEKGYSSACIRADQNFDGTATATGVWSPDSI